MSKYSVKLTQGQRTMLETLVKKGRAAARTIIHAQVLLKTDSGPYGPRWKARQITEAFEVGETTIKKIRRLFVEEGMDAALLRKKQPSRPEKRKITGMQEAQIIAVLCTEQPKGRETWTLRALTDRVIELEIVEEISHETIRTVLNNNQLKPWQKKQWCIGETGDGNYVYRMEDVIDVYVQPYDPKRPQVCLDEGSVQFKEELIAPLEMKKGKVKKIDYHYNREGFCSIFLACEPLTGKRAVHVTERRTKTDFAHFLKYVVDEMYPEAEKVIFVMDNLSTHTPGALYYVFPAEEASRIWKKVEIHYTPVHGSWLNMAEIELSVLGRQVLQERLSDLEKVKEKVAAWVTRRNGEQAKLVWRFTTSDARIKLERLYPSLVTTSEGEKKGAM